MNEQNEKERISHPSFGQISFSRINSNGTEFYGSELKQDNYIQLEVNQSEVERTLSRDWYFTKHIPIIKLRLTANQFSELLTNMNHGSGIPCTIEMVDGKRIPEYPITESRKEFVHRKFEDRMREFAVSLKTQQKRVKELTDKKTLSKNDQLELNRAVDWLTTEVASNIPFFAKCFQENMDEVVLEAKSEVENAILHKITTLGLSALHEQNKLLK